MCYARARDTCEGLCKRLIPEPFREAAHKTRDAVHRSGNAALRWLLHSGRQQLAPAFVRRYLPDEVFWNDDYVDDMEKWRRLRRHVDPAGRRVLILGCGACEHLPFWCKRPPDMVCATDIELHVSKWDVCTALTVRGCPPDRAHPIRCDGRHLPFKDSSFDLIVSDAVLEHVARLDLLFGEAYRVLRPGGVFYASAGPLYSTWGGTHALPGYEHLGLSHEQLAKRIQEAQFGKPIWFERGYLNELAFADYVREFDLFQRGYLGIVLSSQGLRFAREHPDTWKELTRAYDIEDLLIKGFVVVLRKLSESGQGRIGHGVRQELSPDSGKA